MRRDWNPLARTRGWMRRSGPRWREVDWSLVVLLVGFVLVAPIGTVVAGVGSPLLWASRFFAADPMARYEKAIAAAAVKRPNDKRLLKTIDQDVVRVVTFRRPRDLPTEKREFDIWVALKEEIRDVCAGTTNPVRKIQQVLGLSPTPAADHVVTEIEVARDDLVRPCFAGHDVKAPSCEFKFPDPPAKEADAAAIRREYDQLSLVAKQMWNSYRVGFDRDTQLPIGDRKAGFPFTGMGWSYDWAGGSRGNFGVTEFVIKRAAVIKVMPDKKPADFCAR